MSIDYMTLWLVILVAAGIAWLGSCVVWMLLPHHRSDYLQLPDEERVRDALNTQSLKRDMYCFPFSKSDKDMNSPIIKQRMAEGPIGFMTLVEPGGPRMSKLMIQQILYFLFGCALIAYVVALGFSPGDDYLAIFRLTSAVAFATFGFATIPEAIWYGRRWSVIAKYLFDSLFYALLVAGVFGWLWPYPVVVS